jgi:hypothetical protein
VIRVRRGADPDLIVRLPSGIHAAIAMSWTNYATSSDSDPPSVSTHLLDINGLRQIVRFLDQIRQEGRSPVVEES